METFMAVGVLSFKMNTITPTPNNVWNNNKKNGNYALGSYNL